jgi:hypothetical protein
MATAVSEYPPALALAIEDCIVFCNLNGNLPKNEFVSLLQGSVAFHLDAQRNTRYLLAKAVGEGAGPDLYSGDYHWIVGGRMLTLSDKPVTNPGEATIIYVAQRLLYKCRLEAFDIYPSEVDQLFAETPPHYFGFRDLPPNYVIKSCA